MSDTRLLGITRSRRSKESNSPARNERQATYTAEDYTRYAEHILNLEADQCDPVIFQRRQQIAENLRKMAADPSNHENIARIERISIFDFTTSVINSPERRYYLAASEQPEDRDPRE